MRASPWGSAMAAPDGSRPGRILLRNLVLVILLAVGLFILFTIFNRVVLHGFSATEVILLEAGAVACTPLAPRASCPSWRARWCSWRSPWPVHSRARRTRCCGDAAGCSTV